MSKLHHLSAVCLIALGLTAQASVGLDARIVEELWDGRLYQQAFEILSSGDEEDSTRLTLLGIAYEEGLGVEVNPTQAVKLYRRAATTGHGRAAYRLGRAYEEGIGGVRKNALTAFSWYERGADSDPRAAYHYAMAVMANQNIDPAMITHDPVERVQYAADAGLPDAMVLLSKLYRSGNGVPENRELAIRWLKQAGVESIDAQRDLGILEAEVEETHREGLAKLRKAFNSGDALAAAYLGHYADRAAVNDQQRRMALEYYEAAHDIDFGWLSEARDRLRERFRSPQVLGMHIYGTRRDAFRAQLDNLNVPMLASSPGFWDAYDSSELLPGSRSLTVAYAPGADQYVAEMAYRFETDNNGSFDPATLTRFQDLKRKLESKYGTSKKTERDAGVEGAYWTIGKTTVLLKRMANSSVVLIYRMQPFSNRLAAAIEKKGSGEKPTKAVDPL